MQLLQERNFSTFISDTFKFFKENWKHFLTNYFIVNGLFLIVNALYTYTTMSGLSQQLNLMQNTDIAPSITSFSPGLIGFLLILMLLLGILNYAFVPIYMILYNKNQTDFDYKDILKFFKANSWKIFKFILVSLLIIIPVVIVFYILMILLFITIVGVPLLMAAFLLFFVLAFYEYLNSDKGAFESFGYAIKMIKSKFFATTGSTAVLMLILYFFFGTIFASSGVIGAMTELSTGNSDMFMQKYLSALASPQMMIGMVLMGILYSFIQIGHGIIYFGQKEFLENISAEDEIDNIGNLELED